MKTLFCGFRGGEFMKNRYKGVDCLKGGGWRLGHFAYLRGGLGRKRVGGLRGGGLYPDAHYESLSAMKSL